MVRVTPPTTVNCLGLPVCLVHRHHCRLWPLLEATTHNGGGMGAPAPACPAPPCLWFVITHMFGLMSAQFCGIVNRPVYWAVCPACQWVWVCPSPRPTVCSFSSLGPICCCQSGGSFFLSSRAKGKGTAVGNAPAHPHHHLALATGGRQKAVGPSSTSSPNTMFTGRKCVHVGHLCMHHVTGNKLVWHGHTTTGSVHHHHHHHT